MKTLQTVNGHRVVLDTEKSGPVVEGVIMCKPPHDRDVLRVDFWRGDRASPFNPTEWDLVLEDRS